MSFKRTRDDDGDGEDDNIDIVSQRRKATPFFRGSGKDVAMSKTRPTPRGLEPYWNKEVSDFATLPKLPPIEPGQQQRHRIYSYLLMAIMTDQWNGNKHGNTGDYGIWRGQQVLGRTEGETVYDGGSYLGHNIAALAVDGDGRIIDFDFNHNSVFNSSVEHAESRLVRRLFMFNDINKPWRGDDEVSGAGVVGAGPPTGGPGLFNTRTPPAVHMKAATAGAGAEHGHSYGSMLDRVTIYTSLESCAQCSGIMTLGNVKEIVYLQQDQGQYLIGNIMWKCTHDPHDPEKHLGGPAAPKPIAGDQFDFEPFTSLNDGAAKFAEVVGKEQPPFYRFPDGRLDTSPSVTSYLCTDHAHKIYNDAHWTFVEELESQLEHGDFQPPDIPTSLTNKQVLDAAKKFFDYTKEVNNRGTPHRV